METKDDLMHEHSVLRPRWKPQIGHWSSLAAPFNSLQKHSKE
jgi:hypothetical protein